MENEYPKLVRDRIPEIIREDTGKETEWRAASTDSEFLDFLLKKMVEEALELQKSTEHGNLEEELADIFEVIYSILSLKEKTIEEIVSLQKEKRAKRGGFEKRIIMLKRAIPKFPER